MPLRVQVFSDYVCPYCFLAKGPLNEAVEEFEGAVKVEWMPFELRPHPTPTLEPQGDYLQSEQLRRGRERLAINSVPTFIIDNRLSIPGLLPKDALVSVFHEQLAAVAE